MPKIAKTYHSDNGFTSPRNLSDFGRPITIGNVTKHIGLEEFNFCEVLLKNKLMYLPAFSRDQNLDNEEIYLFYLNQQVNPSVTYHYATIRGVQKIQNNIDIIETRNQLIQDGLIEYVFNNQQFRNDYSEHFYLAFKDWIDCFFSNNIIAEAIDYRFIVNIKYQSIEIINNPIPMDWNNFHYANNLYNYINLQDLIRDIDI